MKRKTVTLAVHSSQKTMKLKQVLEAEGIVVYIEDLGPEVFAIKVAENQLSKALTIVETNKLFSYDDKATYQIDDGRKRILVAVDFSSYSLKACQIAFGIAKVINAKVKILHVYHNLHFPTIIPFSNLIKEGDEVDMLDKSRRNMLDLCLEIDDRISKKELPSVNYSYSLREGLINEEVDCFIKEYKPVLVVLGTKGKDNNQNYLLGGVTADIIEMTNVPIIAVPENSAMRDISEVRHVAFFTNLNKRDLSSFDLLVNSILSYKGLKITLVHAIHKAKNRSLTEPQLQEMKLFFKNRYPTLDIGYKLIEGEGQVDSLTKIKEFVENEQVNVVALNTPKRNLFGRIFIPSASRKILASLDVIMLALRGERL